MPSGVILGESVSGDYETHRARIAKLDSLVELLRDPHRAAARHSQLPGPFLLKCEVIKEAQAYGLLHGV
jgi:hypothetical protein